MYSNPEFSQDLCFPYFGPTFPDRFLIFRNGRFIYNGRENFKELLNEIRSLKIPKTDSFSHDNNNQPVFFEHGIPLDWVNHARYQYNKLLVYGTIGYGKLHILTALTCFLHREKQIVYVPDCHHLTNAFVEYLKPTFLLAFSKMPQHIVIATIWNWTTTDQIIQFCTSISAVTSLYFIVDQWNSLDDDAYNSGGARAKSLVLEMTFKHYLIMGSSANSRSIKELEARQDSIKKYTVYGDMTQVCNLF